MIDSNNKDIQNKKFSKMSEKKLYVKYVVCLRDKIVLQSELDRMGFHYEITVHGAIRFLKKSTKVQYQELKKNLLKKGYILLDEKESVLIDRIINTIVEVIHYSESLPNLNFHDIVNKHVISGEESLLKIFSDVKGMSILQFIVVQKIERAKELMLYEDLSLKEIAEILNYKNKDYLAAQFKKTTGLTPRYFERLRKERMAIVEKHTAELNSENAKTS